MRMADLKPGSEIVGNEGRRVGTISSVGQEYIVAATRVGSVQLHIPASGVGNVRDGVVWLNVASADVESMGWQEPPRTEDTLVPTTTSDLHRHV